MSHKADANENMVLKDRKMLVYTISAAVSRKVLEMRLSVVGTRYFLLRELSIAVGSSYAMIQGLGLEILRGSKILPSV